MAICSIKINDVASGLIYSKMAIEKAGSKDKNRPLYFYLAALCSKLLDNFDEAEIEYDRFREAATEIKHSSFKHFTFGIILGFFTKSSKLILSQLKQYDQLHAKLGSQFSNAPAAPTGLSKYLSQSQRTLSHQWSIKKRVKLLSVLSSLPFFCRFSHEQLFDILLSSSFRSLGVNRVLLLRQDEVAVIVSGEVDVHSYGNDLNLCEVVTHCSSLLAYCSTGIYTKLRFTEGKNCVDGGLLDEDCQHSICMPSLSFTYLCSTEGTKCRPYGSGSKHWWCSLTFKCWHYHSF
eukprot:TRINITY_DN2655_c0_g3_i1.p1 TRINITY_DN2655_c0_g3~~TRINITY_DN2655_c0_g3_i1.p1  ORF type:complete len:290 (-),score=21.69 TRINITY_DN2655_c0_g3_i1:544-1413(-)